HVKSSPIDLGLVQGLTTQLTNVSGTVQANIDVTGSVGDPHPLGDMTLQNGAFTVQATGVPYAGIDGRIDLQEDHVHVDQIRVLDNRKKVMTIAGDLAVHELSVGQFNVALKADDFKVIDNKTGNIRVDSDLRLTGELRSPRIEGELGVTTGTLNLDPILAETGSSAYATTQTEYVAKTLEDTAKVVAPSLFERLSTDIHLTVPDDLVVKARDLTTPGTPLGLGT